MKLRLLALQLVAGALLTTVAVGSFGGGSALALSGSGFQPGRIIDDQVFYNSSAMTVAQIQTFLNTLVPTCDSAGNDYFVGTWAGTTYHAPPASPSILRKNLDPSQYPAPYTCVTQYLENTTTHETNVFIPGGTNNTSGPSVAPAGAACDMTRTDAGFGTGVCSAAQIFYAAQVTYGINAQVLITTMEKESVGPLLQDDWPWYTEYTVPMGYACPDGSPCSTAYYGFYNQVSNAAWQFHQYAIHPNNYGYTVGANTIKYNPNSACGTQTVNIVDQSTASLYDYTPYVPNQAALNNLYGTGDSCSSYGNRNFWRIFNDWFGSTTGGDPVSTSLQLVGAITTSPSAPIPGQPVTATYTVQNVTSSPITFQASVLQCRYNQTAVCDPAWGGSVTIAAGAQQTFNTAIAAVVAGNYDLTPYFELSGTWYRFLSDIGGGNSTSLSVPAYVASMSLVGPITSSPAQPVPGQSATIAYTVKNNGTQPAIYQNSILQCRVNTSTVCDPAVNAPVTISPGATKAFSNTFVVGAGSYSFVPYYEQNNTWYMYAPDSVALTGNVLPLTVPRYVASMQLIGPIYSTPAAPLPGQSFTVTYIVKNVGALTAIFENSVLQCRLNTATVCDPSWNPPVTINAGAQQTFSNTFVARAGSYAFTPYFEQNDSWYLYGRDTVALTGNMLPMTVTAYVPSMKLVGPITVTPSAPTPGQTVTVAYTVQNVGSNAAIFQNSVLQCRFNTATVCDPSWNAPITINAGAQLSLSNTFVVKAGTYTFVPYFEQNDSWYRYASDTAGGSALQVNVP